MPRLPPILVLGTLLWAGCSKSPPEPIWIGHLAPLTGPDKVQGEHSRQGVRLALEEIKDATLVAGQPIAIRHADTRGDPERLQTEAVRLLTLNKVAALLDSSAAPLAERLAASVRPYNALILVAAELPGSSGDGLFSLGAGAGPRGRALAQFAASDLKAVHAVVLTDARPSLADVLARAFVKEWRKNAKARAEEWSYRSDADLAELTTRAAKAKPDVLLFASAIADLDKARRQWEMAGLRCPVLFG